MLRNLALAATLAGLLAACGGAGQTAVKSTPAKPPVATRTTPTPVRPPAPRPTAPAQRLALPGLEGVIGATRADLVSQFGPARLDVWEGDARKLQFSGEPCVLDVYLYPAGKGGEPQATYLDARRGSDGKEVDRAGCVAALRKRG